MKKPVQSFLESDVTNVYSAFFSASPRDLARSLFNADNVNSNSESQFIEERVKNAESRIRSFRKLAIDLQPDYECSSEKPIRPWCASDLFRVRGRSWPSILGMRIVIPKSFTKMQKVCLITNLLSEMTCIR